ncbi:MAG: hypothetical protein ACK4XJ_02070 [Fimbriimonadaceae bacterium]
MWAPGTATEGESFLWYRPEERLQIGVALLWKQGAFRGLGNYVLIPETKSTPNLRAGFGLQGIGTGNPGYFVTSEKNWALPEGDLNLYGGMGWRANESHSHLLGGVKFSPRGPWTLGFQHDGHDGHPFIAYRYQEYALGAYLIAGKSLGIMFSWTR